MHQRPRFQYTNNLHIRLLCQVVEPIMANKSIGFGKPRFKYSKSDFQIVIRKPEEKQRRHRKNTAYRTPGNGTRHLLAVNQQYSDKHCVTVSPRVGSAHLTCHSSSRLQPGDQRRGQWRGPAGPPPFQPIGEPVPVGRYWVGVLSQETIIFLAKCACATIILDGCTSSQRISFFC